MEWEWEWKLKQVTMLVLQRLARSLCYVRGRSRIMRNHATQDWTTTHDNRMRTNLVYPNTLSSAPARVASAS